jgi:hypothetical protein
MSSICDQKFDLTEGQMPRLRIGNTLGAQQIAASQIGALSALNPRL